MNYKLFCIERQLDLLCIRAGRIGSGPCRDYLIQRIERLNVEHHLLLAKRVGDGETV